MDLAVSPASEFEKPILRNLMELYLYEFTQFDGAKIGPYGLYGYPYLDNYWTEPERHPFLLRVGGSLAGFALVSRYNYFTGESDAWVIAEFFVMHIYRRQGIGSRAARCLFDQFPGDWQVGQLRENTPATAFWRGVIGAYTRGQYQESNLNNEHWRGPVQIFTTPQEP